MKRPMPRARQRRGLAPLEFVLWLPVLLFVMALMVNFGTLAAWRLRGEVVARDAVWRGRYPRTGSSEPRPAARIWPADATVAVRSDVPFSLLDDPELDHPVVRGPLPNRFQVRPILDPDETGAVMGVAEIRRKLPLLPKLGDYKSGEIQHRILVPVWQSSEQGIPNAYRRTKILYRLPQTDQSLPRAFADAVLAILNMANAPGLDVLDADEEVAQYRGRRVDFHPRVRRNCQLDPEQVKEQSVDRWLTDTRTSRGEVRLGGITRLPRTLTDFFLNMYRSRIQQLKNLVHRLEQMQQTIQQQISDLTSQLAGAPPQQRAAIQQQIDRLRSQLAAIPGQIADAQAEIAQLEPKIQQLEAYQQRLPEIEDDLKASSTAK